MIEYIHASVGENGRVYVRMSKDRGLIITLWERDGDDWLICDCHAASREPLTEAEIGEYSVIGARIVKAMTEDAR